jgi:hypothetical protein
MTTKAPPPVELQLSYKLKQQLAPLADLAAVAEVVSVEKVRWSAQCKKRHSISHTQFVHLVAEAVCGRNHGLKEALGEREDDLKAVVNAYSLFFVKAVGSELKQNDVHCFPPHCSKCSYRSLWHRFCGK